MCNASGLNAVFKRELTGYFVTPVAYVIAVVFLIAVNALTFYAGGLYEREYADLLPFFNLHPWLYLFLVPAVSMRLWAEERKSGTIEMLFTLPIPVWQMVVGKFLAAWVFVIMVLLCTIPLWLSISYLGNPDHGLVIAGYWGSALMAGAYLSIGSCISALTKNQVIAFVLAAAVCFVFTLAGSAMVLGVFEGWMPQGVIDFISAFSFLSHFNEMQRGIFTSSSVFYYLSFMALWLFFTYAALIRGRGVK